ncbi:MAG: hypothetical protein BGO29_14930 [Bacteroidales bacterium 36-12]|nr:MAG: hypothetical protein BGO29_14930 [Bacteroidales bacterium 36-12]
MSTIKIKKVKLTRGRTLEATLIEYVTVNEIQAQNEVVKKCDYLAHNDLLKSFENLTAHMINICELACEKKEVKITGFTLADGADGDGVILVGQKTLSTGKILNLVSPLTEFFGDEYLYGEDLSLAIDQCIEEVELYLNEGKSAIKRTAINFDEDDVAAEINIGSEEAPKKRGRKKSIKATISVNGEKEIPIELENAV